MITKPKEVELSDYFKSYVHLTESNDLIAAFKEEGQKVIELFQSIPPEKENFNYEDGKWTIKEVLQHIIDSERIFGYRSLRFSRKDTTELAGYDDNLFIQNSNCTNRSLAELTIEFILLRQTTQLLFQSMNVDSIDFVGKANGNEITSRIIGWMIVGHALHHCNVVKERYLIK